ncbi:MAG: hypothetical protein ABI321_07650 [Polyangia bacterium]
MRRWSSLLVLFAGLACASMSVAQEDPVPDAAQDGGQPLDAAPAAAVAATSEPAPVLDALLRGRVYERGSVSPVADARIVSAGGLETKSDSHGRFELLLPAGDVPVVIISEAHEPMHVTEHLVSHGGLNVEYRLTPLDSKKRFRSKVRGESHHEGERFELRDEELHMAPGTLGDPFRTIALLPGVAAPVPLLPLWVVRGSSPGTNGFFLDGMRIPQLFHFLVGGGIVQSSLVDRIDFYPSAYDATFGRFSGGIVNGETRPARDGYHGQVELKLYDLSGLVEATLPKGVKLTLSGHYGWPAFLVHLFDKKADLQYWDFQMRLDWKGVTVQALGSFDSLSFARDQLTNGQKETIQDRFRLAFYRVQIRDRERWGRVELETGVVGGIDELASFGGAGVRKESLAFRANVSAKWKRFRLLGGAEIELQRFSAVNFSPGLAAAEPDALGDFAGSRGGQVGGGYIEGVIDIVPRRFQATVGTRLDFYHAGPVTLLGLDPRMQLKAQLLPQLSIHGGTGLYQQAPSFPVGLPGIDTFALQLGLQRAWQSAVGIEVNLPKAIDFSISGYYNKFWNLNDGNIIDVVLGSGSDAACASPPPESLTGFPAQVTRQLNGAAYGLELLLRRKVGRVTGWIAYTLSKSERIFSCGLRPGDFDQRHILNVVVQVRLPWRLIAGAHLYFASGRPYTSYLQNGVDALRNDARLPNYVQVDLRLDREWLFKKWAISAFLEVVNLTYSRAIFLPSTATDATSVMSALDSSSFHSLRLILPTLGVKARL